MDILQFISSMTSAVAWPAVTTAIVFTFRKEIRKRIADISKMNLPGGFSAEFKRELDTVEARIIEGSTSLPAALQTATESTIGHPDQGRHPPAAEQATLDEKFTAAALSDETTVFDPAAPHTPHFIVINAWEQLEMAIRQFVVKANLNHRADGINIRGLIRSLQTSGQIDQAEADNLMSMHHLRLQAKFPVRIDDVEALRFSELAKLLTARFLRRAEDRAHAPS